MKSFRNLKGDGSTANTVGSPDLIELAHDEHRHPHEVKDAVEEHPQHPWGAGGDLGQVEPEAVLGITGGAVDPPV